MDEQQNNELSKERIETGFEDLTAGSSGLEDISSGFSRVIPVIEEQISVEKKVVETGKVHISKVSEEETAVSTPVFKEEYHIERKAVNQVVDSLPQPVRYEGDTMIIPVLHEVTMVVKRYEIMEEIYITKKTVHQEDIQQVSLRKETISIERSRPESQSDSATQSLS